MKKFAPKRTPELDSMIREMKDKGVPVAHIATELSVSRHTVYESLDATKEVEEGEVSMLSRNLLTKAWV